MDSISGSANGIPYPPPRFRENTEVMTVVNKKEDGRAIGILGDGEAQWLIDRSYMPQPTFGTILSAAEGWRHMVRRPRHGV